VHTNIPIPIAPGEVHVWKAHWQKRSDHPWDSLLSEQELKRAARFGTEALRQKYEFHHGVKRVILGCYLGIPPFGLPIGKKENGKPILLNEHSWLHYNMSHSDDYMVMAVSKDVEVGVDIEKERTNRNVQALAERFFHPQEVQYLDDCWEHTDKVREFHKIWVRKEAFVKAHGAGLGLGLHRFAVNVTDKRVIDDGLKVWEDGDSAQWQVREIHIDREEYFCALAYKSRLTLNLNITSFEI
jgi:4'-phosphopantetheinyl transferase